MEADFTIDGWDEFVASFSSVIDKWDEKLDILLRGKNDKGIAPIMKAEIDELVPADTTRLLSSFSIEVGGDYVKYYTNVEYALYVDEGHVQHKRFLPAKYLSVGGRKNYLKGKNQQGIMLKEKYVKGAHFIDKGMQKADPRIDKLAESWIEQIMKEAGGGML